MRQWIDVPILAGSHVLGGSEVFCDWTIPPDGFTRFLVIDNDFREVQGGRLLQRLYEIETYRMMALLAFPPNYRAGDSLPSSQAGPYNCVGPTTTFLFLVVSQLQDNSGGRLALFCF